MKAAWADVIVVLKVATLHKIKYLDGSRGYKGIEKKRLKWKKEEKKRSDGSHIRI